MFVEAVDQRSLAESCSGSVDSSPGNGWEVKETRGTTGVQSNYQTETDTDKGPAGLMENYSKVGYSVDVSV